MGCLQMHITIPIPEYYLGETPRGAPKLSPWPGKAWGGRRLSQPWSHSSRYSLCAVSATSSIPEHPISLPLAPTCDATAASVLHIPLPPQPGAGWALSIWNKASTFVALISISLWWLRDKELWGRTTSPAQLLRSGSVGGKCGCAS